MDDTDMNDASLAASGYVLRHEAAYVLRREGMKIKNAVDRIFYRFHGSGLKKDGSGMKMNTEVGRRDPGESPGSCGITGARVSFSGQAVATRAGCVDPLRFQGDGHRTAATLPHVYQNV